MTPGIPLLDRVLWLAFLLGSWSYMSCTEEMDLGPVPPFTHAFVANAGTNSVSVIDLKNFKNIQTIPVGQSPAEAIASPTDDLVFVANLASSSISVIDSNTHKVLRTIAVGKSPMDIKFSSDARYVYVACFGSNLISVIDCETLSVIENIHIRAYQSGKPFPKGFHTPFKRPHGFGASARSVEDFCE